MLCDKCNRKVPRNNDAAELDMIISGMSVALSMPQSRHLRSTPFCEGSPSRAQYLADQPRDKRYPYDPLFEEIIRTAYEQMQNR